MLLHTIVRPTFSETHKTPAVKRWLTTHPRFVLHFTPNLLELAEPHRTLVR